MSDISVTPARLSDLDEASQVLAAAFADDPVLEAIVPAGRRRHARLTALFRGTLAAGPLATGVIDLARDVNGRLLGVAAWEGPGSRESLSRSIRQMHHFVEGLGWGGLLRAARLSRRVAALRPGFPHWYLAEIGVDAAARGRGVGRLLLETRLAAIDGRREAAYLESSTAVNRRLYARLGFEEMGEIEGVGRARPMAMLRSARAE